MRPSGVTKIDVSEVLYCGQSGWLLYWTIYYSSHNLKSQNSKNCTSLQVTDIRALSDPSRRGRAVSDPGLDVGTCSDFLDQCRHYDLSWQLTRALLIARLGKLVSQVTAWKVKNHAVTWVWVHNEISSKVDEPKNSDTNSCRSKLTSQIKYQPMTHIRQETFSVAVKLTIQKSIRHRLITNEIIMHCGSKVDA